MQRTKLFTPAIAVFTTIAFTADCARSVPARLESLPTPLTSAEHESTIAAMRPPKRERPLIAVVGQNAGTETTDYVIPYAVLAQAGVADVFALATEARALRLTPALRIRPQATTAAFDERFPDGADYVIVPKIEDSKDEAVVSWIQAQAAKGATVVGICAGTLTLSAAGLLTNRSATGHWYDIDTLREANPTMRWVRDRRYVVDRNVITTTGVSASLPVSIALVEAIAGRERATKVAQELGVESWDARHDSTAFRLDGTMRRTALSNKLAFWRRETYVVAVTPGVDDVALAFAADAWSRTFRSQALALADNRSTIRTRNGLELLPDVVAGEKPDATALPAPTSAYAGRALPTALAGIAKRYGDNTAAFVALQIEYAWNVAR